MCLLTISVKNTPPEVVKLAKIAQNSGFSRLWLVQARTFERKVIDLVIGSNERFWSVDVPFGHFSRNPLPEVVKLAKLAQNSGFSRPELVRARNVERKVIDTWL